MEIGGGGDLYVTIKTKPLTDHQITCLSASERHPPHPILMFSDQDVSRRYYELQHQQERVDAKEWLRARGLLAALPSYNPNSETVSQFAARIEQFCSIKPGSILTMHSSGTLTTKPEWAEQQLKRGSSKAEEQKFWCLLNSLTASNLEERGVRFGFIGNEAYSAEESQK